MPTTAELAVQLAELGDEIDRLSDSVKEKNAEYEIRERQLIEQCELEKTKSITVKVGDGARLVSVGKKFFAKRKDDTITQEDVYNALIADGIEGLATRGYNANSLTAYLKIALQEEGSSLPPQLAKLLDVREHPQISIRKK